MAKSPFPGMDPFLERDWLDVHSALVTYIRDQLQEQLPAELCARMESRVIVAGDVVEPRGRRPGVHVAESPGGAVSPSVAVLDAIRIPLRNTDEDVILRLQPLIALAYERGRYGNIDYTEPLYRALTKDEAAIVEQVLKQAGGQGNGAVQSPTSDG